MLITPVQYILHIFKPYAMMTNSHMHTSFIDPIIERKAQVWVVAPLTGRAAGWLRRSRQQYGPTLPAKWSMAYGDRMRSSATLIAASHLSRPT